MITTLLGLGLATVALALSPKEHAEQFGSRTAMAQHGVRELRRALAAHRCRDALQHLQTVREDIALAVEHWRASDPLEQTVAGEELEQAMDDANALEIAFQKGCMK